MNSEKWMPYNGLIEVSNLGRVKSLDRIQLQNNRWGKTMKVLHKGKPLKPCLRRTGYYEITISNGKEKEFKSIHRLVGILFCPIPEHLKDIPLSKLQVDHIDGNKLNNRADNLRWTTPVENSNNPNTLKKLRDVINTKEYKENLKKALIVRNYHHSEATRQKISEANKGKKMSEEAKQKMSDARKGEERLKKRKPIIQIDENGSIKEWTGAIEAAKCLKLNYTSISACCRGNYNKKDNHTYKGCEWYFKSDYEKNNVLN